MGLPALPAVLALNTKVAPMAGVRRRWGVGSTILGLSKLAQTMGVSNCNVLTTQTN